MYVGVDPEQWPRRPRFVRLVLISPSPFAPPPGAEIPRTPSVFPFLGASLHALYSSTPRCPGRAPVPSLSPWWIRLLQNPGSSERCVRAPRAPPPVSSRYPGFYLSGTWHGKGGERDRERERERKKAIWSFHYCFELSPVNDEAKGRSVMNIEEKALALDVLVSMFC